MDNCFLSRQKGRLGATVAGTLAVTVASVFAAPALAIEHDRGYGEPYALLGNRIVFTTWYFVYPGKPDWRDASGNSVYAREDAKLGRGKAFFYCEDCPEGIDFIVEKPERGEPAISREKPWEAMGVRPLSLQVDDGVYRMWARCQDKEGKDHNCYFRSTDGSTWERPNLGLVEFEGSTENNLYPGDSMGSVFIDPAAPADERYKTVWHGDFDPERFEKDYKNRRPYSHMALETDIGRVHSIRAAVSPDGFRWTELRDPVSVEPSDTDVIAYYDQKLEKYVMYTRSQMVGSRAPGFPIEMHQRRNNFSHRRAIGRSESKDFKAFPLSEVIIEPGTDMKPTDSYYTNCRSAIPGAPDHHLMFPAVYHLTDDTTSIELHTSYDGKTWHRAPGGYILDVSTEGQWDSGCIFAVQSLVELANGTWVLPYVGFRYPHKFPRGAWSYDVGLMRWPKGRLMALAAEDKGEFTTVAFVSPGDKLRINAVTRLAGGILIEACDFNGKPLVGRSFGDAVPIVGDQYRSLVTWKGHDTLGVKKGEPLVLRVRMDKARIYALDFE